MGDRAITSYQVFQYRATVVRINGTFGMTLAGSSNPGENGAYVANVIPGGGADNARIDNGDMLLEVNGEDVSDTPYDQIFKLFKNAKSPIYLLLAGTTQV